LAKLQSVVSEAQNNLFCNHSLKLAMIPMFFAFSKKKKKAWRRILTCDSDSESQSSDEEGSLSETFATKKKKRVSKGSDFSSDEEMRMLER